VSTPIDERLQLLDAHYTWQVSAAVEAGRMDLVRDLANDYHDEALAMMLAAEGNTSSQVNWGTAEYSSWAGGHVRKMPTDAPAGGSDSGGGAAVRIRAIRVGSATS
jgi:hypothetical protein